MTDQFVSPTRRYVITYKHETIPDRSQLSDIGLPAIYPNNITGAISFFINCGRNPDRILSCVPYEAHIEELQEEEKASKHFLNQKPSRFVSPSRRYIFVYKNTESGPAHLYDMKKLSELFVNNVSGAIASYKDKFGSDSGPGIISCKPYEFHLEQLQEEEKASKYVLVSPTRRYVVYVENPDDPNDGDQLYLVRPTDKYGNDEIGAVTYLYEKILADAKVTNCLPYEIFVEMYGAGNNHPPFTPYNLIDVKKGTYLVSPTSTYVLFTAEELAPSGKHYYRLEIPMGYENNPFGAKKYFSNEIDPKISIIACIPAEIYDETDAWLHRDDYRELASKIQMLEDIRISVGKVYDEIESKLQKLEE